jgi:hypothetical protein
VPPPATPARRAGRPAAARAAGPRRRPVALATVRPRPERSSRTARRATRAGSDPSIGRTPGSPSRGCRPSARAWNSVATKPGFTACTRTPRRATSRRRPVTNPSTPRLLAEYAVSGGSGSQTAEEDMTSTSPSPRRSKSGSTRRVRSSSAVRFVVTIRSTSSADMSTTAPTYPTPALWTITSTGPWRCAARTSPARCAPSRTSQGMVTSPGSSAATTASRSTSRAHPTTVAPSATRSRARQRPIPEVTPVTSATRPSRLLTAASPFRRLQCRAGARAPPEETRSWSR